MKKSMSEVKDSQVPLIS